MKESSSQTSSLSSKNPSRNACRRRCQAMYPMARPQSKDRSVSKLQASKRARRTGTITFSLTTILESGCREYKKAIAITSTQTTSVPHIQIDNTSPHRHRCLQHSTTFGDWHGNKTPE